MAFAQGGITPVLNMGLEEAVFVVSRFLKKNTKTGVKGCSRDPGVMIVYNCTCLYRYFTL